MVGQNGNLLEKLQQIRVRWLSDGTPSVFSEIISQLAYGKAIAKKAIGGPKVTWSEDNNTLYYCGEPISMESLRSMIKTQINEASMILHKELLLGDDNDTEATTNVLGITLKEIRDDMSSAKPGYYFAQDVRNNFTDRDTLVLRRSLRQNGQEGHLFERVDGQLKWLMSGVKEYEAAVMRFLRHLFIVV